MNEFISELIQQVYEDNSSREVFAVYPGRFQPAGPHHFKTYQWLVSKFGKDKVYITTSDKVELPDSPLNFEEKKMVWMKYGVPSDKIVKVKSPYQSTEVLDMIPEGSSVVFGFGQKDADRFTVGKKKDGSPSFLQWYEQNKENLEDHTKRAYLIILPHNSLKVDGKELSGTQIRDFLKSNSSDEMFKKIFGWSDPKIQNMLKSKLSMNEETLTEGGNMFGEVSMVKRENLDATIKSVLKSYGLGNVKYSLIGNVSKPLLGDIDIAIDTSDIAAFLGLSKDVDKDSLFKAIEEKIPNVKTAKGLNQFHLQGDAPNQKFINKDGTEENKPAKVQIDVMLGVRQWREKWYSGAPNSEYKAMFRNLFIAEIFATIIEDEGGVEGIKRKHMVTPAEGFFLQKFIIDAKGKKKELSRELKSTNADFLAEFLFGEGHTFSDIDTFEKVYKLFNSDQFKFPQYRQEILAAYKQNMDKSQKSNPDLKHPSLKEDKISIQRFSGNNEMTDVQFLEFLKKIQPMVQNGKIDLTVNDKASVSEKLDGSPCMWGINQSGKFFIESANSGEITIDKAEKFNNAFVGHFYEALKFLNSYKPFQTTLQTVFKEHGAFKVTSEMFPMLTHKGDDLGDVVFCSTRYNKAKLGEKGAFVCFSAVSERLGEKASDSILKSVQNVNDSIWKVYNINVHGNLEKVGMVFDISGLQDLVTDDSKLSAAINLLKGRGNSPEKDALKKTIASLKTQLQSTLNQYAEKASSFLGGQSGQYPIEGVVLKVKLPNEDVFIKGTSTTFHKIAEKTWGTRKAIGEVEKVFEGEFLKTALGMTTAHAATLNKTIAGVRAKIGSETDDATLNKVALGTYNALKSEGVDISPEAVKSRAKSSISTAIKSFKETVSKWNETKKTVDADTIRKTEDQIRFLGNKLNSIKTAVSDTSYSGTEYIVYLLRMIIDKRLKSPVDNG